MDPAEQPRPRPEPKFPRLLAVLGFLLVLALTACVSQQQYQPIKDPRDVNAPLSQRDCRTHQVIHPADGSTCSYMLGFVEFDDQGWLFDPRQLEKISHQIKASANDPDHRGVYVLTFTHGWEHHASDDDDNVEFFEKQLAQIAATEKYNAYPSTTDPLCRKPRKPRQIIGIFMGWRGKVFDGALNKLSFWDRKDTAQRVGQRGLTDALLVLRDATYDPYYRQPDDPHPSRLILMGHSFGGAAMFAATSQLLLDRMVQEHHGNDSLLADVADLVVLINPAFEAAQLEPLLRTAERYASQRPQLAIFTSETDWATGSAFPAGRFFSDFYKTHRSDVPSPFEGAPAVSQWAADRDAVGHFPDFMTHRLVPSSDRHRAGICPEPPPRSRFQFIEEPATLATPDGTPLGLQSWNFYNSAMCLIGIQRHNQQQGVLNVEVSSAIFDGHDINQGEKRTPDFVNFIIQFMRWGNERQQKAFMHESPSPATCQMAELPRIAPVTRLGGGWP